MASHNDRPDAAESQQPSKPDNTPRVPDESGFRAFQPDEAKPRRRVSPRVPQPASEAVSPINQPPASVRSTKPSDANEPTDQLQPTDQTPQSPPPSAHFPAWRNADRAQRWSKLPLPDVGRLQIAQVATFLAVPLLPLGLHGLWFVATYFWSRFATTVLHWGMGIPSYRFPVPGIFHALVAWGNTTLPLPSALFGFAHILDVLLLMEVTFLGAPYVLELVLKHVYQMQPLSIARLGQVSPEAQRRIQTISQQRNQPLPQLGLLDTKAPIVFTCGTGAKNVRIVLSQGLLDQLHDAEIAAVCSGEMGHVRLLNLGLMTWIVTLIQIPYLLYRIAAELADYLATSAHRQKYQVVKFLALVGVYLFAFISAIGYIAFDLWRWSGLWFARERSVVADHAAANLTGNPNGQARALLKIAYGISLDIRTQQQTDFVLEAFELAMPVGDRQALTLGSLLGLMPVENALAWDWHNGQRYYLNWNNSHALLGKRLAHLRQYAEQWQLPQELAMEYDVEQQQTQRKPKWPQLLVSGLPFACAAIGYGLAMLLWLIAWFGFWLGLPQLAWLGSDWRLMYAFPLIGFGIGTLIRFNRYFPDLPSSWKRRPPKDVANLATLVQAPQALPHRAHPTALTGNLMGRRGVSNWLCQDLLLQSQQVLVRLHYPSYLGWLTNLLWADNRAIDLLDQHVSAIGWLRRGATPWMDVEILQNTSGKARRGGHQVWSVIVGIMAVAIGLIWLGGPEDLTSVLQRVEGLRR